MGRFMGVFFWFLLQYTAIQASDLNQTADIKSPYRSCSLDFEVRPSNQTVDSLRKSFEEAYRACVQNEENLDTRNAHLIELVTVMKNEVRRWLNPQDRAVGYYVIVNYDLSLENLALAYYYGIQHLKPEHVTTLRQDFLDGVKAPSIYQIPRTFPENLTTAVNELIEQQIQLARSQAGHLHPIEYEAFWREQPLLCRLPTLRQARNYILDNLPIIVCLTLAKTLAYVMGEE